MDKMSLVTSLANALEDLIDICERSDNPIDCFSKEFIEIKEVCESAMKEIDKMSQTICGSKDCEGCIYQHHGNIELCIEVGKLNKLVDESSLANDTIS